jgi:hypothetical protein
MNMSQREREIRAWFILDEIAVKHSATHLGSGNLPCPICDRATEAMSLLTKPYPEECRKIYNEKCGTY